MMAIASSALAAPGELDRHFGYRGTAGTSFSVLQPSEDSLSAVASLPDGKTMAVGTTMPTYDSVHSDLEVVRYNADGSVDRSFGNGGIRCICVDVEPEAMTVDSQDRLVIVGSTSVDGRREFAVLRLHPDGSLDPSFGGGGIALTAFQRGSVADDVAIQGDGRVVVSGLSWTDRNHGNFALARYNRDGTLDQSFGARGRVVTALRARTFESKVAVLPSGNIVVAGDADQRRFAVLRYTPDGTLDGSFGIGGLVMTAFGDRTRQQGATDILAQQNGMVVAAGYYHDEVALARYRGDGSLDPAFGNGGTVTDAAINAFDSSAALQADGEIVVAGELGTGPADATFAIVRYRANGTRDPAFGADGVTTTGFPMAGGATALSLDSQGHTVAAGTIGEYVEDRYYDTTYAHLDFALARYENDGSLDPSFGDAGKVQTNLSSVPASGRARLVDLLMRPSGNLIGVGSTASGFPYFSDLALAGFRPDGRPNYSFATAGKAVTDLGGAHQVYAASAVMLPGGRVLVGGGSGGPFLARYTPDGSLDQSFGERGLVRNDLGSSVDRLALEPSGNILVVLNVEQPEPPGQGTALAEIRPDGTLDTSFGVGGLVPIPGDFTPVSILVEPTRIVLIRTGSDRFTLFGFTLEGHRDDAFGHRGRVSTSFGALAANPSAAVIAPGGKLVLVGDALEPDQSESVALVRYQADGRLDHSFGVGGKVITPRSGNHAATSVVAQPDGKIVTGEISRDAGSISAKDDVFAISRYTARGQLDRAFGDRGTTTTSIPGRPDAAVLMPNGDVVLGGTSPDGNFVLAGFQGGELPRVDRRVSIKFRRAGDVFKGQVRSRRFACTRGQDVKIFRKRPGRDHRLGMDRTGRSGGYQIGGHGSRGRYYAEVNRTVATGAAICGSTKSRVLRL
jgi:uncharacterized delta-60 repeat protein